MGKIALMLALVVLLTRKSKAAVGQSQPPGSSIEAPTSSLDSFIPIELMSGAEYIQAVYNWGTPYLDSVAGYWTLPRLKALTIAAADYWDVPAEYLWGISERESGGHKLVLLYGAGSPGQWKGAGAAIARPENSVGMYQILRSRYESEQKMYPANFPWYHYQLADPVVSAFTAAADLRRGFDKGSVEDDDAYSAAYWWAQNKTGALKKEKDIRDHGYDVFSGVDESFDPIDVIPVELI